MTPYGQRLSSDPPAPVSWEEPGQELFIPWNSIPDPGPAAHMLQGFWLRLADAEGRQVDEVMVKVVDFPPVSGFPLPRHLPSTPVPPLLPQPAHWALEIQALCLRLQTPMEAHQRPPEGRGHPRPDCWAAPDLLKSLVGLH